MDLHWKSIVYSACGTLGGVFAASFAATGSPSPLNELPGDDSPVAVAVAPEPQLIGAWRSPVARRTADHLEQNMEREEGAIRVDWESERISLPLDFLDRLAVAGFTSESQLPSAEDAEAFVLSEELRELLQIDPNQAETIRKILADAHHLSMSPQWGRPTTIREEGDAVVMEIDPASSDLEASIRESLGSVIGERRAAFLMKTVAPTLDWEFGGFGRVRRVIEVSVLADDTISLRESLRANSGAGGDRVAGQPGAQVDGQFELRTRQFRVDRLPDQIAAFVSVEAR